MRYLYLGHFMKPVIDSTSFGSMTILEKKYCHDIVIRLNGDVKKRKKKLSKLLFGTSHIVSLDEIKQVYEPGAELLIIGSGQNGMLELSREAKKFLSRRGVRLIIKSTPKAVKIWNEASGASIGLFHVTC